MQSTVLNVQMYCLLLLLLLLIVKYYDNSAHHSPLRGQGLSMYGWTHVHLSAERSERSSSQYRGVVWSESRILDHYSF